MYAPCASGFYSCTSFMHAVMAANVPVSYETIRGYFVWALPAFTEMEDCDRELKDDWNVNNCPLCVLPANSSVGKGVALYGGRKSSG